MERILKSCKIVLASGSPRRKDLLADMGIEAEILVPGVDEKSVLDSNPKRLVIKEALLKNRGARSQFDCGEKVVISADTIVYRGKEYTKPRDLQNAVEILTELCGKWHSVYTGVVVYKDGKEYPFAPRMLSSAYTQKRAIRISFPAIGGLPTPIVWNTLARINNQQKNSTEKLISPYCFFHCPIISERFLCIASATSGLFIE